MLSRQCIYELTVPNGALSSSSIVDMYFPLGIERRWGKNYAANRSRSSHFHDAWIKPAQSKFLSNEKGQTAIYNIRDMYYPFRQRRMQRWYRSRSHCRVCRIHLVLHWNHAPLRSQQQTWWILQVIEFTLIIRLYDTLLDALPGIRSPLKNEFISSSSFGSKDKVSSSSSKALLSKARGSIRPVKCGISTSTSGT